jgi:hypothetical protein
LIFKLSVGILVGVERGLTVVNYKWLILVKTQNETCNMQLKHINTHTRTPARTATSELHGARALVAKNKKLNYKLQSTVH